MRLDKIQTDLGRVKFTLINIECEGRPDDRFDVFRLVGVFQQAQAEFALTGVIQHVIRHWVGGLGRAMPDRRAQ